MDLKHVICIAAIAGLTACETVKTENYTPMSVAGSNAGCSAATGNVVLGKCDEWAEKQVRVTGTVRFEGEMNEPIIASLDNSDHVSLKIVAFTDDGPVKLTSSQQWRIKQWQGEKVDVYGTLNTNCAKRTAWAKDQVKSGDLVTLGGYCQFQPRSYLTNFRIRKSKP